MNLLDLYAGKMFPLLSQCYFNIIYILFSFNSYFKLAFVFVFSLFILYYFLVNLIFNLTFISDLVILYFNSN